METSKKIKSGSYLIWRNAFMIVVLGILLTGIVLHYFVPQDIQGVSSASIKLVKIDQTSELKEWLLETPISVNFSEDWRQLSNSVSVYQSHSQLVVHFVVPSNINNNQQEVINEVVKQVKVFTSLHPEWYAPRIDFYVPNENSTVSVEI